MTPTPRLLIAASALLATVAAHGAPADDYAYAWPLQTQGDSAAWQVELTPEVYAAVTRADLGDVEVINAAGASVPISQQLGAAIGTTHEGLSVVPVFSLPASSTSAPNAGDEAIRLNMQRGTDGRLHALDVTLVGTTGTAPRGQVAKPPRDWLLDASAVSGSLQGLRIDWIHLAGHAGDVTPQFSVSASDDLQQWHTIVASASLLHLEQDGNTLDRHEIPFAGMHAAYLRVRRLDDGSDLPSLEVKVRTVSRSGAAQAERQWLQAALDGGDTHRFDSTIVPAADGTSTVAYRYHLPAPLAVEMIRVGLADDNSLVRISVISLDQGATNAPSNWTLRKSAIAFRLRQGNDIIDNDDFGVSQAGRARDWRIELATPLTHAPTLGVGYRPDRFVFLAQGAGPYRLVAGSARTHHGDYPIETALAPLRAKLGADWQPPLATLGPRATVQGEAARAPAPPPERPRDWRTWLLWTVLVGAAALIGGLALSLLRKPPNP